MTLKKNVLVSIFVFALCLIVSSFAFTNFASAEISGDYVYTINGDDTASITDYTGLATDVTIPSSLDGHTVTAITNGAFGGTSIVSVVIPDSVITITNGAFSSVTTLTSVDLGEGVQTIDNNAFSGTSITDIIIPDSVTTIGNSAFYDVITLTSVDLGEGVETIGISAFSGTRLTSVVIPNSVTNIGNSAFYETELTSVVIPDSVITIDTSAFSDSALTEVVIGNGVITIGSAAFYNNQMLTDVTIGNSVNTIDCNAFGNTGLKNVVIPDSVNSICSGAFTPPLESIIIGSGMTTIPGGIFAGFSTLKNVTLRNGIINIEGGAFWGTGLTSIIIPSSVDSISGGAFGGVSTLTSIYFSDNAPSTMNSGIFDDGVTIYYISGKTGFDEAWNTYNTVALNTPTITTNDATAITETGAILNGTLTNNGGDDATIKFEYGITEEYGTEVELEGEFTTGGLLTSTITGLTCGTTYHYNVTGTNFAGIGNGGDKTFITSSCPVVEEEDTHHHSSRVIGSVKPSSFVIKEKTETPVITTTIINTLNIKRLLKLNMIGDDVKELQSYLNNHGYPISLTGPGSKGYETTKFGPLTKKAVIAFQKANGLTPDGIVGLKTLEKMK